MAYNMHSDVDADLALAMKGLLEQQRMDYGDTDGFSDYEEVINEFAGAPSEATYAQYMYGVNSPISDGPISIFNERGSRLDGGVRNFGGLRNRVKPISFGAGGRDGVLSFDIPNEVRYDGPIGHFHYKPDEFAFGYKRVGVEGAEADIPILYYVGDAEDGNKVNIPDGCTSIRYMCEGNDRLKSFPAVREGVMYMDGAFKDCVNMEGPSDSALQDSQVLLDDGSKDSRVARLSDSVKSVSGLFYGCKNLTHGYDYVSAYSDLRNMNNYGSGTQLPLNPERGLNLNDLMIGRELRHDGTGVILDSSAVREMELMANKNHVYNTEVSRSYDGGYVNNDGYNNGYSYVDNYDYQQDVPNYYQDGYDRSVANGNFTRNVPNQYVSRPVAQFSPAFASDPNRVFYNQDHASYSHADEPVVVRTPDVQGTHNLSRAERLAMAENLFGNIDMGGYGGHSTDYEK